MATALLGAVILGGCGAGGDSGGASASPTPSPTSVPSPVATSAPGPSDSQSPPTSPGPAASSGSSSAPAPTSAAERLVTVTRSGGFAGKTNSLLIKGDGSWTRLDAKAKPIGTGKLPPDQLRRLRSALQAADFAHLPRVSKSGGTVYDGFTYVFVHGGFEVVTADGSVPSGLQDVLSELPSFDG
ncbi:MULTISPECIES: hypothetical protein [unclassified Streptomyces]|uniref:hypothetical protein n=1 Tax=unclassified Streptomyces TaxID=2593676 RepID=UPI00224E8261|nr:MULTISPECIES: hypothetical protein [unclassified Streptomyces]MCX4528044.1 hypothetical protein [Streptomyces sp. NBC_01551]MCX4541341.1 hypothetical protein [Streptomyces sp. NBC_01565]